MYLIPILSIAIHAGLIVHVIKTGRNMLWIWAIALLPLVGSIAYAAVEVLPQVLGGRTARRAKTGVRRMIDPDRDLRRATAEVEISGNVDARRRLAEELFERGRYDAEAYQAAPETTCRMRAGIGAQMTDKDDFVDAARHGDSPAGRTNEEDREA